MTEKEVEDALDIIRWMTGIYLKYLRVETVMECEGPDGTGEPGKAFKAGCLTYFSKGEFPNSVISANGFEKCYKLRDIPHKDRENVVHAALKTIDITIEGIKTQRDDIKRLTELTKDKK